MAVNPTISYRIRGTGDKGHEAAAMDMACVRLSFQERFDLHEVDFQKRGVTQPVNRELRDCSSDWKL
jgi:hypothetical protein